MRATNLLLLFLVSAPAQAQTEPWANKLFDRKVVHNFGVVPRGANLLHVYPIKNVYAVPLTITEVRVSCGCVTAKASKTELQPGETATIEASMDTRRVMGKRIVTIFVSVGPRFVSTAELKISATTRSDVVFNPGHVDFGVVSPGEDVSKSLDVEYAGVLDWRIREAVTTGTPIRAGVKELYRRQGIGGLQVGYRITVSLTDEARPGMLKESIVLKTNDPRSTVIPLHVEANVQALLSVSPGRLDLGKVEKGSKIRQRLVVQGKKPFRVTGIGGGGEGVALESIRPAQDGRLHVVTLQIELGELGAVNRELIIQTDAQKAALKVPLVATVRLPAGAQAKTSKR